jgi:hypothetical protein
MSKIRRGTSTSIPITNHKQEVLSGLSVGRSAWSTVWHGYWEWSLYWATTTYHEARQDRGPFTSSRLDILDTWIRQWFLKLLPNQADVELMVNNSIQRYQNMAKTQNKPNLIKLNFDKKVTYYVVFRWQENEAHSPCIYSPIHIRRKKSMYQLS